MLVSNNGRHIVAKSSETTNLGFLTGGPLREGQQYAITELRLHFGSRGQQGSEHTIDGKLFAAEV